MTHRFFAAASVAALIAGPAVASDWDLNERFEAGMEAEDAAALAALFEEDAISYGPDGQTARGRAEIQASWQGFFDAFDNITLELAPDGSHGDDQTHAEWGIYTLTMTPAAGGEEITSMGRYTDYSVKSEDGWRYKFDHASPMAE
ncbi:MAG: SgcJ/EcaC family oxidoreductase [Euryhalocaulis sp.]|uniref:YybH family protein n=1 Tax=Euryhalocaulis sp. TaxID=2744307 RepID=UPI0017A1498C|nr:SgcJ/EcaC family oxidoreductase [Euryhalocaulis sp.]MBA4802638.1 SgcJ/EcaC family oxidoreductase [Euryhalocaulis sp.]